MEARTSQVVSLNTLSPSPNNRKRVSSSGGVKDMKVSPSLHWMEAGLGWT